MASEQCQGHSALIFSGLRCAASVEDIQIVLTVLWGGGEEYDSSI